METKPYRIQSPEDIAKDYGGNKQKIAQAMQLGVVDPTAGVLAGMFIDRMRSAQMQEMAPQTTVAQKVMGGAPAQAPLATAGGLGATAPAMPPMAPQGGVGAPPMEGPMPEEAPMGMAAGGTFEPPYMKDGGLSELPIPDGMFDENRDGGYAGGGLIAFARGGMSNLYDAVEYWESGGKQSAVSPKGARGVMQLMPGTMRDPGFGVKSMEERIKAGMSEEEANRETGREYLDAMYRRYGDQTLALAAYNWGPGNVDKWLKSGADPKKLPAETRSYISKVMKGEKPPLRERDLSNPQGQAGALEDYVRVAERYTKPSEEELSGEEMLRQRYQEMGSDDYYEKQRKDSMWEALATLGANMASSKAPSLLQAIGEAAKATLPGMQADKKERKELKDRALQGLADLGIRDRKRRLEALELGMNLYKTGVESQQAEKLMQYRYDALEAQTEAAKAAAASGDTMFERLANTFEQQIRERIAQGIPVRTASGEGFITFPKGKPPTNAEIKALANDMAINRLQQTRGGGSSDATAENIRQTTGGRGGSGSAPSYEGFSATQVGG